MMDTLLNQRLSGMVLAGLAFASNGMAGDAVPDPVVATMNAPAVTAVGPVDQALMDRAVRWTRDNLAVDVPVRVTTAPETITLNSAATALSEQVGERDAGLVALVWTDEPEPVHGFMWPDARVVIVNVRVLMADGADEETIARRIERQVIRGVAMLYGLEASPNPLSAMWNYTTLEQLDAIGRNLDPPWLRKLQQQAEAWGVAIDTNSSFFLLR